MRDDFRQRSAAALTHPATLVALAAMIVNDLVLKTLFPGAWAVGKIRRKTTRGCRSVEGLLNGFGLARRAWSGADGLRMSEPVAA